MVRTRLFVMGVLGGLLVSTLGVVAAPPPPARPTTEPVPFARVLALTVQEISERIVALHKALPPLAARLEPIEETLKGLRDTIRSREEVDLQVVQVELLKLDLHLHRLLFELDRGAREMAEFRGTVREFLDRFTARMDPRMAHQFQEFAQGLIELTRERFGERWPGMTEPELLARIVGKLKDDVNRLDLLLLRSLEATLDEK